MDELNSASSQSNPPDLLGLHIAEYQTLTARNTTLVTLLYALWSLLFIAVALLAQLHEVISERILVWCVLWLMTFAVFSYFGITVEAYNNVRYLECELRPRIASLLGSSQFWLYESYLAAGRPVHIGIWEQSPLLLGIAACLGGALWSEFQNPNIDITGMTACVLTLIGSFMLARVAIRLREDFSMCARKSAANFPDIGVTIR
jgi:hypothetical protein